LVLSQCLTFDTATNTLALTGDSGHPFDFPSQETIRLTTRPNIKRAFSPEQLQ
jgi:hypothetical protein